MKTKDEFLVACDHKPGHVQSVFSFKSQAEQMSFFNYMVKKHPNRRFAYSLPGKGRIDMAKNEAIRKILLSDD